MHVQTVLCPECGCYWTGMFAGKPPEKAPCKNCVAHDERLREGHPDVVINPSGK